MKVLCIDAKTRHGEFDDDIPLDEGETYNVVATFYEADCSDGKKIKGIFYQLGERRDDSIYDADRFIPCSDIDEREFISEENKSFL